MIPAIIGLILGILFAKLFLIKKYRGPSSDSIKIQIFKKDNKCYRLEPIPHVCPINAKHI